MLNLTIVDVDENEGGGCTPLYDPWNGDYDCPYGSDIECENCIYGPLGGGESVTFTRP